MGTETLGKHKGTWMSSTEILQLCRDRDGNTLEFFELVEDSIIYVQSQPYEIFLEDSNRERFFVIPVL